MALITPPEALPIRRAQWTLRQPHQVNRSGWTGRRQVSTTPGAAAWGVSAELIPVRLQANAKKWRAFFASLKGQVNHFPVVAVEAPQHGGANPTITAGSAGATTLTLSSSPPALVAGDFMTVKLSDGSYQLVCLTAPISGTTATFLPPLRRAAATGSGSVETIEPYAHVTLAEDVVSWDVDRGQTYSFALTAEELIT